MDIMQFEAPDSVEAAVALLADAGDGGRILAGGTDLLVQLRAGMVSPSLVIDVKKIAEMMTISEDDGVFTIGAAVPSAEMGEHPTLKSAWPGVVEAMDLVGSTQIQGRASLGGNLCNASPAADSVPAMIVGRAVCNIVGPNGRREAPVEDIATGPGQTSLATGEIVVSITLPKRPPHSGDAYLRFIPRTEMDIAVVGAAVDLTLDDDGVMDFVATGLVVLEGVLEVRNPELRHVELGVPVEGDVQDARILIVRAGDGLEHDRAVLDMAADGT